MYSVRMPYTGRIRATLTPDSPVEMGLSIGRPCQSFEAFCSFGPGPQVIEADLPGGIVGHIVVDGVGPLDESTFTLAIEMLTDPPEPVPEDCATEGDEDGDDLIDCADPDCASTCADACSAPSVLGLYGTIAGTTEGHANTTDGACQTAQGGGGGGDVAYTLQTRAATDAVTINLASDADLGVFVRSQCDQVATELGCADADYGENFTESLTVDVAGGEALQVLVGGFGVNDSGRFLLSVTEHMKVETACADGTDDDHDGDIDCADSDCSGSCCGNGVRDGVEECDGADLGGIDCFYFGFGGGELGCDPVSCTMDLSACVFVENCTNGIDDDFDSLADCDDDDCAFGTYYVDNDNDGYGDPTTGQGFTCPVPGGYVPDARDCDDGDANIHPLAIEACDATDNDCDGDTDETPPYWYVDADEDGFGDINDAVQTCTQPSGYVADYRDCDDANAEVNPQHIDVCDGVDNDCDGTTDGPELCDGVDNDCDVTADEDPADGVLLYEDQDTDGYGSPYTLILGCPGAIGYVEDGSDCDDASDSVSPEADEICNFMDDDCDGATDELPVNAPVWYADVDMDGFGDPATGVVSCIPPYGYVVDGSDCADSLSWVNPSATESCNGIDEDCDATTDEDAVDAFTFYADADADGYGDPAVVLAACSSPDGYVGNYFDCDDADPGVSPSALEVCNGVDDDCDSNVDDQDGSLADGSNWYIDADGDGFGNLASPPIVACLAPPSFVSSAGDCNDTRSGTYPGASETCNGNDDDCDATADEDAVNATPWYADLDGDGYAGPSFIMACSASSAYGYADSTDCDDDDIGIAPNRGEGCDGVDNDCDSLIDDEDPSVEILNLWYPDLDGDGFGDSSAPLAICDPPPGYLLEAGDCDDGDELVNPGALEVCNGIDDDCDAGTADCGP
jgi:hypothetical protein